MTSDEDDLSMSPARNVPYNHRIQFYKLQRVLGLIDKNMTLVRTKVFEYVLTSQIKKISLSN